jgi:glycosyltransferase involved in cell wall biosynthesis
MPKVSVIVPIYNVSAYIERCARSLFEQTLDDLEILFINDCTPDNSIEIIERILSEYPNRRSLTRIIKMPSNGGQAPFRRHGIIEATGDFIIHCDGDDWIDADLYEKMYNQAIAHSADIVVCNYTEEFTNHSLKHDFSYLHGSAHEYLKTWYSNTTHMSCCNKLIKKSVYYNNKILPWEGLNMWEDNGLVMRLFYYSDKIVHLAGSVYHYNRMNQQAMTSGYGLKQVNQMISVAENLTAFFKEKADYEEYQNTVYAIQFLAKLNLITDSFAGYKRFRSIFPECNQIINKLDIANCFSQRGRLRFYFVKYHLAWLFIVLFKIKNYLKA